eukprot:TRINITY_DN122579_c0_g1_i1.p1 TRINITY_DN122579_c0_g1~~TRINITY_DN122579_c0_g1_i1.p1  ORF type:complete len:886 (-),score=240.11 TRINITY_DN122579_c0_g1_i1:123-2780(-)
MFRRRHAAPVPRVLSAGRTAIALRRCLLLAWLGQSWEVVMPLAAAATATHAHAAPAQRQRAGIMRAEASARASSQKISEESKGVLEDGASGRQADLPSEDSSEATHKSGKGRLARRIWRQLQENQEAQHGGRQAQKAGDSQEEDAGAAAAVVVTPGGDTRVEEEGSAAARPGHVAAGHSPAALASSSESVSQRRGKESGASESKSHRAGTGAAFRNKVKTRLDSLEKSELASQKTFYRLLQRLERVEKRQDEMQKRGSELARKMDVTTHKEPAHSPASLLEVQPHVGPRDGSLLERLEKAAPAGCQRFKNGQPIYRELTPGSVKCLAGVPIYNFHKAFEGSKASSLAELLTEVKTWLVTFPSNYTDLQITEICQNPVGSLTCSWDGHPSYGGMPVVIMKGSLADLEEELSSHPDAYFVEPDHDEFADPEQPGDQAVDTSGVKCALQKLLDASSSLTPPASWGLDRLDDDGSLDCRSQELDGSTHGQGSIIWVLDTGVRVSHNEFEGRAHAAIDLSLGEHLVECRHSNDPKCALDYNGHGTHCAGTAAGKSFGVANKATIMAAKVLNDDKSGGISRFLKAMDYIIKDFAMRGKRNATVLSMSVGGKGSSPTLAESIEKAVQAGLVVVVSAGNDAEDSCTWTPASIRSAITVGATNMKDELALYSNYGRCIDILAPGTDILSASHEADDKSFTSSGTSMACPHVAGAAALALTFSPELMAQRDSSTQENVRKALLESAVKNSVLNMKPLTTNMLLSTKKFVLVNDRSSHRYMLGLTIATFIVAFLSVVVFVWQIRPRLHIAKNQRLAVLKAQMVPGARVVVVKSFLANDATRAVLQAGLKGTVRSVAKDGSIFVQFVGILEPTVVWSMNLNKLDMAEVVVGGPQESR